MIGLQSSFALTIQKIKETVQSGRIGDVKNSIFVAQDADAGAFGKVTIEYFADREVGGNPLTIYFGHSIDFITEGKFQFPQEA